MADLKLARTGFPSRISLLIILVLLSACSIKRPPAASTPTSSHPTSSAASEATSPPGSATPSLVDTPTTAETIPSALPPASPEPAFSNQYVPSPGWPLIQPIGEYTPIPPGDPFAEQMQSAGYTLFQSGELTAVDGTIYSASIFTRLDLGAPVGPDTFRLAFYRWEGDTATLLGDLSPALFVEHLPVYPSYYRLLNWDDPATSQMGLIQIVDPDAGVRSSLHLSGYAADINANGFPEFIFAAEFCPVSCSAPVSGFDFFEVGPQGVSDLSAGLPGRLSLQPASLDPLIFEAIDWLPFGPAAPIGAPTLVAWDGKRFGDVTAQHTDLLEAHTAALRKELEAEYGGRFEQETLQADAYSLLLLYERLGRQKDGLEAFLEVTDPSHWPGDNERAVCWLQLARARAQDEFARGVSYSLLPVISEFDPKAEVGDLSADLEAAGYDLSACNRWSP